MQNFNTTSVPMHTVDAESLSKITIHNSQQIWKIEIRIVPYGRKENEKLAPKRLPRSTKTESLIQTPLNTYFLHNFKLLLRYYFHTTFEYVLWRPKLFISV